MKIDSDLMSPVGKFRNEVQEKSENTQGMPEKVNVKLGDTVELASKKSEVDRLKKAMKDEPDFRIDKVERLKAQIAAGTYNVDSKDVAAKLLQSWSDLYGK